MDKNCVKTTIEGLKSSNVSTIQDTLYKIRNEIIASEEGVRLFREANGLEYLMPLLRKPNERILDVALSILGNCCLEEECSLLVSL